MIQWTLGMQELVSRVTQGVGGAVPGGKARVEVVGECDRGAVIYLPHRGDYSFAPGFEEGASQAHGPLTGQAATGSRLTGGEKYKSRRYVQVSDFCRMQKAQSVWR